MGIFIPKVRAFPGVVLCLALICVFVIVNTYIFIHFNAWLNLIYPVLTMMTTYLGITVYRYVTEEREREEKRSEALSNTI